MISPENQALIRQSIAGDRRAQGEIYKKYVKAMFHITLRMIPNKEVAMDVTQDVFVKVFEELKYFRGESTLGAWIKRITINMSLNHLRKDGRLKTQLLEESILKLPQMTSEESTDIEMKQIHEAIKSLPTGSRVVTNLYLIEGYQHKEIAQILDITESTSKTQYRRGRILLQEKLKSTYYHER